MRQSSSCSMSKRSSTRQSSRDGDEDGDGDMDRWIVVRTMRMHFLKKFCPDVQIRNQNTVAWIDANRDPFSHRLRCEINSGTVVGTSVDALALFTYFNLPQTVSLPTFAPQRVSDTHIHPSLFFVTISKHNIRSSARYMFLSNNPASLPAPCIASPLKYDASGPLPSGPFWSAR